MTQENPLTLKYKCLDLERTFDDIDHLTSKLPLVTLEGYDVENQIRQFKRAIQQTSKQIHKLFLVFENKWIEITYGYFAGVHFFPHIQRHIQELPSGYKIALD